jgi:hypothetical protein
MIPTLKEKITLNLKEKNKEIEKEKIALVILSLKTTIHIPNQIQVEIK